MKIKTQHIVLFLLFLVVSFQFIDIYYPNDLFFYGQLTILGIMIAMLIYRNIKKK